MGSGRRIKFTKTIFRLPFVSKDYVGFSMRLTLNHTCVSHPPCLTAGDINPQAPVHILVIPKNRDGLTKLSNAREDQKDILGHLMFVAQSVGKKECPNGFRIVINDGEEGAQSVYHLHVHVLGGRQMEWPPG